MNEFQLPDIHTRICEHNSNSVGNTEILIAVSREKNLLYLLSDLLVSLR